MATNQNGQDDRNYNPGPPNGVPPAPPQGQRVLGGFPGLNPKEGGSQEVSADLGRPGGYGQGPFAGFLGIGKPTSDLINNYLTGVIQGGQTSFSPDVVNYLKSEAKSTSEAGKRSALDQLGFRLASTGVNRSPAVNRNYLGVENEYNTQYSTAVAKIQADKARQDFQDKLAAIDRAQNWLNSLRNYWATVTGNIAQREQALAQIDLGYANLANQRTLLNTQLDYNRSLIPLTPGYGFTGG